MCNYKFFENDLCRAYPCHQLKPGEKLNCLWCYCIFFNTKECVNNGSCMNCNYPHIRENYEEIIMKLKRLYKNKKFSKKMVRKVLRSGK